MWKRSGSVLGARVSATVKQGFWAAAFAVSLTSTLTIAAASSTNRPAVISPMSVDVPQDVLERASLRIANWRAANAVRA